MDELMFFKACGHKVLTHATKDGKATLCGNVEG
jgi:hypothetical protein